MSKRRRVGESPAEFKSRVSKLIDENSPEVELRNFTKFMPEAKFQEIWVLTDGELRESIGYLHCSHQACRGKKTRDKVIFSLPYFFLARELKP